MNYTGYGTDPNLIYSFRGGMATGPAMGSGQYADRFAGLRNSPAYKQADARGRQRMEQAVEMGLPAQTDISRARRTGTVTMDRRPEYVATRPQAWGTWGGVGPQEELPVSIPNIPRISKKGETPKEEAPEGYFRNRYGYLEKDYSKDGYTRNRFGYWQKTGISKSSEKQLQSSELPPMPTQDNFWRMSLLDGGPTIGFPQQTFSYL
jgi:hypothetical protein